MTLSARIPAPLGAVDALIEETLTVGDIVTVPIWSVDPDDAAASVRGAMLARNFDVAAVGPSPLRTFVRRSWLSRAEGTVGEVAEAIPVSSCVDRSLPLADVFRHLEKVEHLFVLNGDHIRWVVTRSDLNAPAVGVVALAYLTVIEGGFRELARTMPADQLLGFFNQENRAKIETLHTRKKQRNIETGIHDCLTLGDWFAVVRQYPPYLQALGFADANSHRDATQGFYELRNTVAHGGRLLDEMDPLDALANLREVRYYAERVWDAVDHSRDIWQAYVDSIIGTKKNHRERELAGPEAAEEWEGHAVLHVISAWNPGSIGTDSDTNLKANRQLRKQLKREGATVRIGFGRSRDGEIEEESFVVSGLTAQRAAAIGEQFGQAGIFEIDRERLSVLRCPDAKVMATRPRRS